MTAHFPCKLGHCEENFRGSVTQSQLKAMNKEEKKGERCNVNRLPSVISQGEVFLNKGLELDLLQWHKGPMHGF